MNKQEALATAEKCKDGCFRRNIFSNLLRSVYQPFGHFQVSILEALFNSLPLKACSLYSYNPIDKQLTLRAQMGFDYDSYETFQFGLDSPGGKCILDKSPLTFPDISKAQEYKHKSFIQRYSLTSLIVYPLFHPSSFKSALDYTLNMHNYSGVVYLYPDGYKNLQLLSENIYDLFSFISEVYHTAIDINKLQIRKLIVEAAFISDDLNSFLNRVLNIIKSKLNIEAASIFLQDPRTNFIRLHATTGLVEKKKKTEVFFIPKDDNLTNRAFNAGKPIFISDFSKLNYEDAIFERVEAGHKALLLVPIVAIYSEKGKEKHQKTIGILRVVNRIIEFGSLIKRVTFGWEDLELLHFITDFIGIYTKLMIISGKKKLDFERVIHGIRTNLQAGLANLNLLKERGNIINILPENLGYAITDNISHAENILWQMEKFENIGEQLVKEKNKIFLAGDVLSKVVDFAKNLTNSLNIEKVEITYLKDADFYNMPIVLGDVEALLNVCKNLVENAMKYTKKGDKKCFIDLSWEEKDNFILVHFSDRGIGIPNEDVEWIFIEGFRSENAIRRNSLGVGLGLSHSKTLMLQMGGDLILTKTNNPTIFTIKIPKLKGDRR